MAVFPFVIHSFSNHQTLYQMQCSTRQRNHPMTPVDGFCLVGGLLKALGECWGFLQGRGIHRQGHKVQLQSHISPQEYQQGKPDSAGGRPSPPMVIIYNGEHDSSIWGTGKVAIFKLGIKKSKHQYCLRSDGKCRLTYLEAGTFASLGSQIEVLFLSEGRVGPAFRLFSDLPHMDPG